MKTLLKTTLLTTLLATGNTFAATIWEPSNATLGNELFNVDIAAIEGGQLALFEADDTAMANPYPLEEYGSINFAMPSGASAPTLMIMDGRNQFTEIAATGSMDFMLGMNSGNGWTADSGFQWLGGDFYQVDFGASGHATLVDAIPATAAPAAVPVPAAAWLLGSALLGLTGLGRKRATASEIDI